MPPTLTFASLEICAGAGGQALGLERAGFAHLALVENDPWCAATLRARRPWRRSVREIDLREWTAKPFEGQVDLFAGGVPCPPFSRAGKQLGASDERDLFPEALRVVREVRPQVVMLENVRGLLDPVFAEYRADLNARLESLGYLPYWRLLHAADFGVPQLRPRTLVVALRKGLAAEFAWPSANPGRPPTVGEALFEQMVSCGWEGANTW